MGVVTGEITVRTQGNNDVVDLGTTVADWLAATEADSGTLVVFCPHTTAGITALEFEPGANRDLGDLLDRLVPAESEYHHNKLDTNGHAHARAALMGPSVHVPVVDREPALGSWQSIALVDFDDRPRARRVVLQLVH